MSGLSLDIIGRNLITWTDYPGYEPEMGSGELDTGGGSPAIGRTDNFGYPNFRSVSVSIQAVF